MVIITGRCNRWYLRASPRTTAFAGVIPFLAFSVVSLFSPHAVAEQLTTIGWVEKVSVAGTVLQAKIDTGADHSSIHVTNVQRYEIYGKRRVVFDVTGENGITSKIDEEIFRFTKIKQKACQEKDERIVIQLDLCIGKHRKKVEVNLVDRANYRYPMLIGRSFLERQFLVDSAKQYSLLPSCTY